MKRLEFLTKNEFFEGTDREVRKGYVLYRYEVTHKQDVHFLHIWVPGECDGFIEWGHVVARFPEGTVKNKKFDKTPDWFQEFYKKAKKELFKSEM